MQPASRGDHFEWALGDNPFVKHQPEGDGHSWRDITHVYAIGRVNGSQYPVIEVWTMDRVVRHLNKYNKVGGSHYALTNDGQNMEMYGRKVALLQVLKYMPKSIEVQRAMDVATAVDSGKDFTFDGEVVVLANQGDGSQVLDAAGAEQATQANQPAARQQPTTLSAEGFDRKKEGWRAAVLGGKKPDDLIAMIQARDTLTEEQKLTIHAWSREND